MHLTADISQRLLDCIKVVPRQRELVYVSHTERIVPAPTDISVQCGGLWDL